MIVERKGKHWTQEENDYLEDKWGTDTVARIAKHLCRSEKAIIARKEKLGLDSFLSSGNYISFTMVLKTLYGYDGKDTRNRLIGNGFPVIKKKLLKKTVHVVKPSSLWKWLEENKDIISFDRMEQFAFGPEPEWVAIKRQQDKDIVAKYSPRKEWTDADDKRLIHLVEQYKYTYNEIAKMMGRTDRSIAARVPRLGIKGLPVKQGFRWWTIKEIEKLHEMYEQGYSWDCIAEKLGRSARSVKGRIERENKNAQTGCNQCKGA